MKKDLACVSFGVRKFRRLLLVGTFAVLAQFLMGFLGSALAGNLLGEDALAGVALLLPFVSFVSFVADLIGAGMGICYSQEMGRGDRHRAHEIFSQGFWTVLLLGGVFSAVFVFGHSLFLDYLGAEGAVRAAADAYCRVYAGVPIVGLLGVFLLFTSFADGDDVLCYIAYAVQLAVNLIVSYAAIRQGWGTAGCALGVLVGYLASAGVLILHFFRAANSMRLVRHFRLSDTFRIAGTAFGDASGYFFVALMTLVFEKYVMAHYGAGLLPVLTVVLATLGLLDFFGGIGNAAQPLVSVYLGERNTRAAREVMQAALKISLVEGVVVSVLLLAFPKAVIALVGLSDPALIAEACLALRLFALGVITLALANVLNGYYIIVEHGLLASAVSFSCWFALPTVLLLSLGGIGPTGVWLAMGLGPVVAFVLVMAYIVRRYGRAMCPFLLPRDREDRLMMWSLELNAPSVVGVAAAVSERIAAAGCAAAVVVRARLIVEEVLMLVRERNAERSVLAEVTLDLNEGVRLTLRDDGEIFDITDADQRISSFRAYIIGTVMATEKRKENLIATGFNRNTFRL